MKILKSNYIILFMMILMILMLCSCSFFNSGVEISDAQGFYDTFTTSKKPDLDVSINQDITLNTNDVYFKHSDRVVSKSKINGNGNTITIEGTTDGKLGSKVSLLFSEFDDVEIKDLNIIYNLTIDLSSRSGNSYAGGVVGYAKNSIISNCTTKFNYVLDLDYKTDTYGFHDYGFGGIVGYANASTIKNCNTTFKADYTGCYLGGIAGYVVSSNIENCNVDTSITTSNLEEAYIGGLVGGIKSSNLIKSYARVREFDMNGEPQEWRNRTAYGGLFIGGALGNSVIKNCYVDRDNDMEVESINNGLFKTTMKCGWIAGLAEENTEFKNLYINGYGTGEHSLSTYDYGENIKISQTVDDNGGFYVLASSFIADCSTLNIKNCYYVYGTDRSSGYDESLSFFPNGYGLDTYLIDNTIVNDSYATIDYFKFVNDYSDVVFTFDDLGEESPWIIGTADNDFLAGRLVLDQSSNAF